MLRLCFLSIHARIDRMIELFSHEQVMLAIDNFPAEIKSVVSELWEQVSVSEKKEFTTILQSKKPEQLINIWDMYTQELENIESAQRTLEAKFQLNLSFDTF